MDVKFLPGESRVLLAGAEGASAIWDLASSRMSVLLRGGHLAEVLVYEAQALPDGERVVTLGSDMLAVVWNASSGEVLQRLQLRLGVRRGSLQQLGVLRMTPGLPATRPYLAPPPLPRGAPRRSISPLVVMFVCVFLPSFPLFVS